MDQRLLRRHQLRGRIPRGSASNKVESRDLETEFLEGVSSPAPLRSGGVAGCYVFVVAVLLDRGEPFVARLRHIRKLASEFSRKCQHICNYRSFCISSPLIELTSMRQKVTHEHVDE